jgi:hypothetical protein
LIFSRSTDCVDPASQASIRHHPKAAKMRLLCQTLLLRSNRVIQSGGFYLRSWNGGPCFLPPGEGDAGMGRCQMEPAMSDKSIAAIATTGTDRFGSPCRPQSTRRDRAAAEVVTLAAMPPCRPGWRLSCSCKRLVTIASGSLTKYARAYSKEKKRGGRKGDGSGSSAKHKL